LSNEPSNTSGISKVWSFCNTLRDDCVRFGEGLSEGLKTLLTVFSSIQQYSGSGLVLSHIIFNQSPLSLTYTLLYNGGVNVSCLET
jgi:hypothetical protein